jgi:hypothetical protein
LAVVLVPLWVERPLGLESERTLAAVLAHTLAPEWGLLLAEG